MADFAPAGTAHRARLADRIRREVVVVHVALVRNRHDAVEALFVADRSEGGGGEHLRLAAREDAGTVNARQDADFRPDRANLVGFAAVGTDLLVDDHDAEFFLLHRLDDLVEVFAVLVFERGAHVEVFGADFFECGFLRELREGRVALALFGDAHRLGEVFFERLARPRIERGIYDQQRIRALFLAGFFLQLVDRGDDFFDLRVRELDRTEEIVLGDFVSAAFDHHDAVEGTGDHDVHAAGFVLRQRRVDDVLAVFIASDAHRGDVLGERDVGNGERRAGCAHGKHVGVEFTVDREHRRHDHDIVAEALFEQRTNRPVDLAGAEGAVLGRPAFALDVAARDLARGVHLFFEFTSQGKEIDTRTRLLRGGDGGKDNVRVAVADENTAVGLLSKLAGLDDQGATPDLERDGFWHKYS